MDDIRNITLTDLKVIAETMIKYEVEYVIFGGVALNIHNVPRETEDIDMFLKNNKENISRFIKAFKTLPMFQDISSDELQSLIDDDAFEYGVIKFGGEIGLNIATSMGERTFDALEKQVVDLDGIELKVVTVKQLYEMKSKSLRQRDIEDAARLRELRGADLK